MKTQTTLKNFEEKRLAQPNILIGGGDDDGGTIDRGKIKQPTVGKEN
tara:strand:+ start:25411 stop:25551 length:141 start_codon:yes stop_codon:yes gene_type:complete